MLEEVRLHRAKGTPASKVRHKNLAKAAGTPDIQGELNLIDLMNQYKKDSSTADASAANANAISSLVMATLSLSITVTPPPITYGYEGLHYYP